MYLTVALKKKFETVGRVALSFMPTKAYYKTKQRIGLLVVLRNCIEYVHHKAFPNSCHTILNQTY